MKQKKAKSDQDSREEEAGIPTEGPGESSVEGVRSRPPKGVRPRQERGLRVGQGTEPQRCEGTQHARQGQEGTGRRPVREDSRALLWTPPPAIMLWRQ